MSLSELDVFTLFPEWFAWLEETLHERLAALERSVGVEFEEPTIVPDTERIVSVDR